MKQSPVIAVLFGYLALGLTGGTAIPRDQADSETEIILQEAGLSRQDAQAMAGGKQISIFYDPLYPAGWAHSTASENACAVSWSSAGETLRSSFPDGVAQAIPLQYDPAIDRDIEKITLLHELAHCTQNVIDEYDADQRALAWYLQNDGNRGVAKYWIYWRAVEPLIDNNQSGAEDPHFGLAPGLYARFFNGHPLSMGASRTAYRQALSAMSGYGQGIDKPAWYLAGKKISRVLIEDMLADQSLKLEPDVRQILGLCRDAYQYLAEGPPRMAQNNPTLVIR